MFCIISARPFIYNGLAEIYFVALAGLDFAFMQMQKLHLTSQKFPTKIRAPLNII